MVLVAASVGCGRHQVTSASPDHRWAVEVGAAGCEAVLPMATTAELPVLHRRDLRSSDNFAAAFRGDARVGPAAWWIRSNAAVEGVRFAGPDRLLATEYSGVAAHWTVGEVSVRNPAQRWARAWTMPSGSRSVREFLSPVAVVVGTTVLTAVPKQVREGNTTRTVAVVCGMDLTDGHLRWGTQVPLATTGPNHNVALLAAGDAVVVSVGPADALVVLGATTGRMRWHASAGAAATVTVSGGLLVLSPPFDTVLFQGLTELRALDLRDGHVAWHHPVPPSVNRNFPQTVVATAPGQPVVVLEPDLVAKGTTASGQLIAYSADGSVRWKRASDSPAINVVGDLVVQWSGDRMRAQRITDGTTVWQTRLAVDARELNSAASGTRLFLPSSDDRSLVVVDLHSGAAATSLTGVGLTYGKGGIPPALAVAGQTLIITVAGTSVGFDLR